MKKKKPGSLKYADSALQIQKPVIIFRIYSKYKVICLKK